MYRTAFKLIKAHSTAERSFLLPRVDKTNHNKLTARQVRQMLGRKMRENKTACMLSKSKDSIRLDLVTFVCKYVLDDL